jgi:hypothetical protein
MRGDDDEVTRERTEVDVTRVDDLFTSEELLAMREQYETRAVAAEERAETLEWELRMALARIRDAEAGARRAADEMARVHATLAALVEKPQPVAAPVTTAVAATRSVVPPPSPARPPAHMATPRPATPIATKPVAAKPVAAKPVAAKPVGGPPRGPLPPVYKKRLVA